MLTLATVILSECSVAISSRTGATILHGPHHSAQKSTSTGLSLPSTSLAKLASVTVTVLPAMVVLLLGRLARMRPPEQPDGRWIYAGRGRRGCLRVRSALVEGLGQPALGVHGRGRTGAGGGDGLPVDVVDDVTGGEDA